MIDQAALDRAVRKFPLVILVARLSSPERALIMSPRLVRMIAAEYHRQRSA